MKTVGCETKKSTRRRWRTTTWVRLRDPPRGSKKHHLSVWADVLTIFFSKIMDFKKNFLHYTSVVLFLTTAQYIQIAVCNVYGPHDAKQLSHTWILFVFVNTVFVQLIWSRDPFADLCWSSTLVKNFTHHGCTWPRFIPQWRLLDHACAERSEILPFSVCLSGSQTKLIVIPNRKLTVTRDVIKDKNNGHEELI